MNRVAAEEWVRSRLSVNRVKTHVERPWGATFKISHDDGRAWLKVVPPCLASSVAATARLAALCPEQVPAVLAYDAERGFLITRDHGLRDLSRDAGEDECRQLLATAARIEASCKHDPELLTLLPRLDPIAALDDLMRFLGEDALPALAGASVSAARFLSRDRRVSYHHLLEDHLPLLREFLSESASLETTVSHGDLRPSNAARNGRRAVILYDWEEAFAAPAGASLHAMFGGCVDVLALLDGNPLSIDPEKLRESRRMLAGYIDALVDQDYADREALAGRALAAAALAGMLRYLVSYSRFPGDDDDRRYRRVVRSNLKRRFSDLLDVCDHLCVVANAGVLEHADKYVQHGRGERAERLLRAQLRLRPDDSEARIVLGHVLLDHLTGSALAQARQVDSVQTLFSVALEQSGENVRAREGLAECLARQVRPGEAARQLQYSLTNMETDLPLEASWEAGDHVDIRARRELMCRLQTLQRHQDDSDAPGEMPTMTFSTTERDSGAPTPATLAVADAMFRRHGVLLLKGVFDPALLIRCRETFLERYQRYLTNERQDDALRIGDKRFQITIDMAEPYDSPTLYGNALLMPLMQRLLGHDLVLGCFTSAMSLPGAGQQRLHKDHKALFFDDPENVTLPSFAITTMVPLVPVDERCGTTRVRKGSHRLTTAESLTLPDQTPIAGLGDCYLMDYRLSHYGQANGSTHPRPILSLVYSRPWFRDYINFSGQPSLRLNAEALAAVPSSHRSLVDWTAEPGPRT